MHDAAGAALSVWLKQQWQDTWAHVIFAGRAHGEYGSELYWMINQPELDQANAIRLFWTIFDERAYIGDPDFIADEEHDGPLIISALNELITRFEAGFYAHSSLKLRKDEAFYYGTIVVERTRRAILKGWDEKTAAFAAPAAFSKPIDGVPLSETPRFVHVAELYKTTPELLETNTTEVIDDIIPNSRIERRRRAERTSKLRRTWMISNLALFVGVPGLLIWAGVFFLT